MAKEEIKLPRASYDILKKVITGYGHLEKDVDIESLSKLIKMNKVDISSQNSFLTQAGIIDGGNKKSITPLGKKLARSYEHEIVNEIKKSLQEIIIANPFLSNLVSTIKLNKGMDENSFVSHILFASDSSNDPKSNTGARAIKDMLMDSGLIIEKDGKLMIAISETPEIQTVVNNPEITSPEVTTPSNNNQPIINKIITGTTSLPQININIQLTVPETTDEKVYEKFFEAMKKHLLS